LACQIHELLGECCFCSVSLICFDVCFISVLHVVSMFCSHFVCLLSLLSFVASIRFLHIVGLARGISRFLHLVGFAHLYIAFDWISHGMDVCLDRSLRLSRYRCLLHTDVTLFGCFRFHFAICASFRHRRIFLVPISFSSFSSHYSRYPSVVSALVPCSILPVFIPALVASPFCVVSDPWFLFVRSAVCSPSLLALSFIPASVFGSSDPSSLAPLSPISFIVVPHRRRHHSYRSSLFARYPSRA
jgi:hypothetical protein